MRTPIYLDNAATTPVDPRVAQKMIPHLTQSFGNPASRSHAFGWDAERAVEAARANVAALVNCDAKEIVWTSGATESIRFSVGRFTTDEEIDYTVDLVQREVAKLRELSSRWERRKAGADVDARSGLRI